MTDTFRAIRVSKGEGGAAPTVAITELGEAELMEGDVTVAVRHSTVNYKDGLALTGQAPILRRSPMTPGIDLAGEVLSSESAEFPPGSLVVLNGWGVGESHDGGFAERARVKADWLIRLPDGLSTAEAMAIGTAGYTAALAVLALERAGVEPGRGDVLVTGAAGGVGSVAIALLGAAGYGVVASSRRVNDEGDYLRQLGAGEVIDAAELSGPGRPLGKERWAAAIDSVGSHTLVNVLAGTRYGGVVAACGLAQGADLPGTVMPFILRGVTLAGIESVNAPRRKREEAWSRLARDLDRSRLARMTRHVRLEGVPQVGAEIVAGKVRGRTVVDL
jgi:acrylyl-CoA reductase (NADPH)